MASTKKKTLFDDDDFGDEDSGSDFDDDEDPDKIEVPGGGRDLETAVTYAKNIQRTVTLPTSSPLIRLASSIPPRTVTAVKKPTIGSSLTAIPGRPSILGFPTLSLLKTNQPRGAAPVVTTVKATPINVSGGAVKPAVQGVKLNYNNNMPKKLNIPAAATANATSTSMNSLANAPTPLPLPKPSSSSSSSSLPLSLPASLSSTVTQSSTSSAAAANAAAAAAIASLTGMGGMMSGMGSSSSNLSGASGYLNSLSTNELMSLAAYVAAKGQGVGPAPSTLTTALAAASGGSGGGNNNSSSSSSASGNGGIGGGGIGAGAAAGGSGGGSGYYQTNTNFNMAASLLAQMSVASGYGSSVSSYVSAGNVNTATTTSRPSVSMSATGAGAGMGSKVNTHVLEKLQSLINANPEYLTSGIPNQIMSQLFLTQMKPTAPAAALGNSSHPPPQEEDEADYEEMGVAETYAEYWPAKLKLGKKHPDPVVETASLSSVEPSDVYYKLSIPPESINSGQLSALQLESITYASQAHDHLLPDGSRAGFLIGDGAGVGKGRTIAGIIYENYLKGRKKALWISVSNDLKYDAERDLSDIGAAKIEVHALNKFKYAKISSDTNNNCKRGVIFSTYSALIGESNNKTGKYRSRFRQLLQWCGDDFEGLIVFDECHKAKNLCPVGSGKSTKTGQTVLELQKKLPKARVVYASATGASEPKNMAYMVRLGLWGQGTAFNTFNDFIMAVEKRGVGAMEVVAMDMKLRGMYIARQLSFKGVTFKIEEVPLTREFRKIYDESVALWVEAMQKFTEAAELIDAESRMKKTMWGQFWSSHQRFFKYLCIAAKVNHAVKVAREAIKYGKCVVIGLQSTGEARTLEQLEKDDGELSDFVSTAKGVFQSFVERHFPAPDRSRINRILGLYETYDAHIKDDYRSYGANNNNNNTGSASGGVSAGAGNKRKSSRNSEMPVKKSRSNSWQDDSDGAGHNDDDDDDDDEVKDDEPNDSDFKLSDSESEMSDGDGSNASDASSDFNPFFSGSDSDIDPWVNARAKKTKKKKKTKERSKEQTTTHTSSATSTSNSNNNNNNNNGSSSSNSISTINTINNLKAVKKVPQSTQDKIQSLLQKKQEMKGTVTQVGVNGIKLNYGPPPKDAIERACSMKEELLRKIEKLGSRLPPNTLDQLIDELGGPENVAEMTGRRGRVVQSDDGSIQYESRTEQDVPLETLNITEKQRFMDGEKDVAIISEAASSGISLQSDRRVYNQRRRVHITLELPWSADRAIQQFGRTHRSNQVNAPEYLFLISDLAGERRFASTVAKRLESLGALTHGDRRATETRDLSQFNIDNKYGRTALETVMKTIMGYEAPLVPPPTDYNGEFFKDIAGALVGVGIIVNSESNPGVLSLDKDYNNISKFLNRILGCPVELQNRLFKYFTDTMTAIINQAKRGGRFDLGIVDLGAAGENVTRVKFLRFVRKHATGVAPTELHTVRVERGMIWQEAINKYADLINDHEGFYVSHQLRNSKRTAILAIEIEPSAQQATQTATHDGKTKKEKEKNKSKKDIMCRIYRPNTGLQVRHESLAEIEKKYKRVTTKEAEKHWTEQYDSSVHTCSHAYWNGNCRNVTAGNDCEVGLRQRLYYVLAGSVLSVWSRVERILSMRNANNKMQVIRMKTTEGEKIVGTLIPKSSYETLVQDLQSDSEKMEDVDF